MWGARAGDWHRCNEPAWTEVFSAALDAGGVSAGSAYLDVGCGAGGALVLAHGRGAKVSGLDASGTLVEIARQRLPGANVAVGDMEDLPFADQSFDFVSGINSFQFAGDVAKALGEAARVCRKGGKVAALVWGPREDSDLLSAIMPGVFQLLPPPSPEAPPPPPPLGEPGTLERLMSGAGLEHAAARDFSADLVFPDLPSAVRACLAAAARAIRHAGEERVKDAIAGRMAPFVRNGGEVRLGNRFRMVTATRP